MEKNYANKPQSNFSLSFRFTSGFIKKQVLVLFFFTSLSNYFYAQTTFDVASEAELNTAISSASNGDIINFTSDIILYTDQVSIDKSLTIEGNNYLLTVPRTGLNSAGGFNTNPSPYRAIQILNYGGSSTVIINALKIRGGFYTGAGGAIMLENYDVALYLNNCEVSYSRSSGGGGGIYTTSNQNKLYINNTLIDRNAGNFGGGIVNKGFLKMESSTITENRSTSGSGGGGAMENNAGIALINNCTISNNQSTEIGGAINNNNSGKIYLVNSSVTGNVGYGTLTTGAIGNNAGGAGGIWAVNSVFAYNYKRSGGTSNNPTAYTLDDLSAYSNQGRVFLYYSVYHGTLPNGMGADVGNVQYSGAADGSDDTIFTGGSLSKIFDASGNQIGTTEVFRPYLVRDQGSVGPTLRIGSFLVSNKGTQTRVSGSGSSDVVLSYFDGSSWIDLVNTSNSGQLVTTDQIGQTRSDPPLRGALEAFVDDVYMLKVLAASNGAVEGGSVYGDLYPYGTEITLTANPSDGYGFDGWTYAQGTGSTTNNPLVITLTEDITIQPSFVLSADETITYVGNGNTGGTAPATQIQDAAISPITISDKNTLVKSSYEFTGWNTVANGSGTAYNPGDVYSQNANLTLYAQWVYSPSPGGVTGVNLWLKGNDGITANSGTLNAWVDKSGVNTFSITGTPGFQENAINFNPTISFNNTGAASTLPTNRLEGNTSIQVQSAIVVMKSNSNSSTLMGSTVSGSSFGPGLFGYRNTEEQSVGQGDNIFKSYFNPLRSEYSVALIDFSGLPGKYFLNNGTEGIFSFTTNFRDITLTPMIGGTNNNGNNGGWSPFDGEVAEIITYPSTLLNDSANIRRLMTYMAIKYGITLTRNTQTLTHYEDSNGTVLWDDTNYWNDVFGIGKDEASELNQIASNSINTGSGNGSGQHGKGNIVITNASSLDDGDFLMIGHDNGALTEQSTDLPASASCFARLSREWKVKSTNNPGSITLTIQLNGLTYGGTSASDIKILIDSDGDGDFSNATSFGAESFSNELAIFKGITLPNNAVFTFITGTETIPPTITTLGDLTFAANAGVCTYETSKLPQPTTDDNCGVATVEASPSVLVLGVNTVTWTVTDVSGNVNTVDQSVTIIDNEKPTIATLSDFTVDADTGVCTYDSSQLPPPVTSDNCGVASVTVSPSILNLGANTVTWTVTDDSGNKNTSTHIVTVQENELPTIATLGAITVHSDAGVCIYSSSQLPLPATSDNCGVASVVANPSELALGLNIVTWTVTDDSGNTRNSIQEVTVVDNEDPTIGTLNAISVNTDVGECTYDMSQLPPPATSDNCGVASVVPSQSILSLGLNTITWTVTDDSGNTKSSIQEITVVDNVAPIVSCPSNQTVHPDPGSLYTLPDYFGTSEAMAVDNCTNPLTILTQSPSPGTQLGDDVHTITFTAQDASGNIGACSFDLIVDSTRSLDVNIDVLNGIKLYPNPTSSIVKIQNLSNIKLSRLTIYDMMGRVINSIDLKQMGEEKEIDLSPFESAVYLFEIHSEQGKLVKSVVKQ
ncbi:HYR domain-containing protein [Aestuariibaculum sp. M13]|uniref:HYR domain-containing protein n=1 Tax=Aestuariibaculum sp. M13 TaxID=2967132 RepID=UPI00215A0AF5|nr:HYR domain-containing protein [Aestuariibaculum sp. M13]MCR8669309.1 HYR domain-containing protein [Aestuariibaculum sp. M13]